MGWRLIERGKWAVQAPWGEMTLERFRREAGEPAGWYLFGPTADGGSIFGRYMAEHLGGAKIATNEFIKKAGHGDDA